MTNFSLDETMPTAATPSWWAETRRAISPQHMQETVRQATAALAGLPRSQARDRRQVAVRAESELQAALQRLGYAAIPAAELQQAAAKVVAQVAGLRFLDALLPPACDLYTDIQLNGDGALWVRPKGQLEHVLLPDIRPGQEEVWQVVETLLAAEGKACSEATPTVDAKLPRDRELGFGGARLKVMHPSLVVGEWPLLSLRLYEPRPVPPAQIIGWEVFPAAVVEQLLRAVGERMRLFIIGGTASGKTTLLSALAHGLPHETRIVTVEDPNEIWLPHPNLIAIEARHAPPGSDVPPYTVSDGVDDALRLAPEAIIVGEVRTGRAAMSLFRAIMSDHAGMTTFHAESPGHAVHRMCVVMYADAQVPYQAARGMFNEAIDLVVQVGWRQGRRQGLGVWELAGMEAREVAFRQLWQPGQETMTAPSRRRQ
ncbi:MAG: CpaF family protein [Caldilineales bacterium]|nr:CpaF family protein [Caldilineales bacterium]